MTDLKQVRPYSNSASELPFEEMPNARPNGMRSKAKKNLIDRSEASGGEPAALMDYARENRATITTATAKKSRKAEDVCTIKILEQKISDLMGEIESLQSRFQAEIEAANSEKIAVLESRIAEQQAEIYDKNKEIEAAQGLIRWQKEEKKRQIITLNDINARYDTLVAEYSATISSKSWRYTKGFRLLMGRLIRIYNKIMLFVRVDRSDPGLLARVRSLANSQIFDPHFVAKQLGIDSGGRQEIAYYYYVASRTKSINPSPLFDVEYYKTQNKIQRHVDPVQHYIHALDKKSLKTHRLFDQDWYISQLPEAAEADDVLAHYISIGQRLNILPCNPENVKIAPWVMQLYFADLEAKSSSELDTEVYAGMNPDLGHMTAQDLTHHYIHHGVKENRIATFKEFFASVASLPNEIPLDFDAGEYESIHVDLADLYGGQSMKLLRHYMADGLREGRAYNLSDLFGAYKPTDRTFSADALQNIDVKTPLCIIIHMYYTDLWGELSPYIENIKFPFDLYVNLVDTTWDNAIVRQIRQTKSDARIYFSQNKGRDIGGFWRLMDVTDFDKYIAFGILHGKKSPHVSGTIVDMWKKDLLGAILGSEEIAAQNLAAFVEDPKIGIIGSAKWRNTDVASNHSTYDQAMDFFKISAQNRDCEYVSGTMMFVRSNIMKAMYYPLKDYDFEICDDKDLSFHMDGQMAHSVERLYGNLMKELGYEFLWR